MRFARELQHDAVPYAYDRAWNQLREPEGDVAQVFALVAGATLCVAVLVSWLLFAPFKPIRIDYVTFAVAIVIVLFLHELAHALAFTLRRGHSLRVECEWRRRRLQFRYEGMVSRNHYVAVLAAPLAAVSFIPVAASAIATSGSGDLVLISMLNALVSGGDVVAALMVVLQVPAGALVRRQGDVVLWKGRGSAG